jgi:predicted Zn-dependent protease
MSEPIENLVGEAQALKNSGRVDEAIKVWRRIVARVPDNLIYQHDLAAILGDAGQSAEAADIAGQAIESGLDRPETHLVYARALAGILDLERAEKSYRTVIAKRPHDATAHRELAQLLWMRTGDAAKSEEALVAAINRLPDELSLQILRAEIKGQMGDRQTQHELLSELVLSSGRHPQICYFAARAALASKAFEPAIELAKTACDAAPDQDDVAAVYATALLANGDAASALRALDRLRMRQPANQYFIALQATAWRMLGDERYDATFDYDAMIYACPLDTPNGWSSLEGYLEELAQALADAHCYREHPFFLSVRHGSQLPSITKVDNPAMRAFASAVRGPMESYLTRLGAGPDPLRARHKGGFELLDAWSVSLPPNGFHVNHVHPAGWLSSACHVRPPGDDPDNPKAGWLKFGEPGCATSPSLKAERFVKPEAGRMVIFPSYMWHGTEAFTKGSSRLTVAADFAPVSRNV